MECGIAIRCVSRGKVVVVYNKHDHFRANIFFVKLNIWNCVCVFWQHYSVILVYCCTHSLLIYFYNSYFLVMWSKIQDLWVSNYMIFLNESRLQWNPSIPNTLGTNISVLITRLHLYYKAQYEIFVSVLNNYRGVLISGCPR